jgi:DNA-binding NarL/FixJ family response regulator
MSHSQNEGAIVALRNGRNSPVRMPGPELLVLVPRSRAGLTTREQEVALLIAHGLTNRQIAQRLVIALRTADNHVQHIFDKLGLSSRAQVAAWAALEGMLGPPPGRTAAAIA